MRAVGILLVLAMSAILFDACDGRASSATQAPDPDSSRYAKATFAGGCFWCMEPPFDGIEGVVGTISGYTGGHVANPTYEQVSAGTTGHTEAVRILYDPQKVSYEQLLAVYWKNVDPLDAGGQFCDRGSQYRSGVFVHDEVQRELAQKSKAAVEQQLQRRVATEITEAGAFYPAENYHQDYYVKNPVRYKYYRNGCGRDKRLHELWGS